MSARAEDRFTATDAVAGFMAAAAILVGAIGVAHTPVVIVPATAIMALVAARMSVRFQTLAAWAVAANVVYWVLGMAIAVITKNSLY